MQARGFRDNRFFRFDPHEAPCAAAKIGKLPVRRRDSRNGRSRIVAGNCYDRHFADPRFPCKRISQLPDKSSRHHYRTHNGRSYPCRFQQGRLELFRHRIQQSGGGSIRIFLFSPEQLENTIKIHDLYAGKPVDFRPGNTLEILFRRTVRIRIAIRTR